MWIDLQPFRLRAYESIQEALSAGQAFSSELAWFDQARVIGRKIIAANFGADWLELGLDDGQRMLFRAAPTLLEADLVSGSLAQTVWDGKPRYLRHSLSEPSYVDGRLQREEVWYPRQSIDWAIGGEIYALTFSTQHVYVVLRKSDCIWIKAHTTVNGNRRLLKWCASD